MARLVALDYGTRHIGLALSDPLQIMALPHKRIEAKKTLAETASLIVKELKALEPIEQIIIGLPLEMSGKEGPMAKEVRLFAEHLAKHTLIPIVFWDERLTSAQAEKSLKSFDFTRKQRSHLSDAAAASIILQSYLDIKRKF